METIDDILREMRTFGQIYNKSTEKTTRGLLSLALRSYADRIEAAHKREIADALDTGAFVEATRKSETVTDCNGLNGAKCREALMKVSELIHDEAKWADEMSNHQAIALGIIQSALAEPARNCDRFECFRDAVRAFGEMGYAYEEMAEWLFCETEGGAE